MVRGPELSQTSLKSAGLWGIVGSRLQFFRELHFIEANNADPVLLPHFRLQFFRELHFIEATSSKSGPGRATRLQFFRELHFIEAGSSLATNVSERRCSSFESCTSLRPDVRLLLVDAAGLQFFRELHFIEADTVLSRSPPTSPVAVLSRAALH